MSFLPMGMLYYNFTLSSQTMRVKSRNWNGNRYGNSTTVRSMSGKIQDHGAPFPRAGHDHRGCIEDALRMADQVCAERGARLTRLRRRVFELIWSSHTPVGAYELLRRLGREHAGAAPPTVYRALDFLRAHGLVHRIESLNAFVGCCAPDRAHAGQFLICSGCGTAAEIDDPRVNDAIERRAGEMGFAVHHKTIEVEGLCTPCREEEQEQAPGEQTPGEQTNER